MSTELTTASANLIEIETQLVREWLTFSELNGASKSTLTAYEKGLRVFADWLKENGTGNVTPTTILKFKAELAGKYSIQTTNLRLTAVRSFYRFLVLTERIAFNPASEIKGVKRPKARQHKRQALGNGEMKALFESCDDSRDGKRTLAILSLMGYCALRQIEINRANIGDLDDIDGRMVLYVQGKGHTEKDEFVIIPTHQETTIREWLAVRMTITPHQDDDALFVSFSNRTYGKRISTRSIQELTKARFADSGIVGSKKTTHSLRHSALTNAYRNGASPMQVQALGRHQSFDTTLIYIHETNRIDNPPEDLICYQ